MLTHTCTKDMSTYMRSSKEMTWLNMQNTLPILKKSLDSLMKLNTPVFLYAQHVLVSLTSLEVLSMQTTSLYAASLFLRIFNYSNKIQAIRYTIPIILGHHAPPNHQGKDKTRMTIIWYICLVSTFLLETVGTPHVLLPGEYFWKPQANLSLTFTHSFYIKEPCFSPWAFQELQCKLCLLLAFFLAVIRSQIPEP